MKLSTAWNWELGIGILEDNVFGQPVSSPSTVDPLLEKRREARISFSLPVRYRAKGSPFRWFHSQSIDVSRNGVRIALDRKVPIGTALELDIKLPEIDKNVRLEGVVVWTNPSSNLATAMECGIAFKNLRQLSNKEKVMYFMADKICSMAERSEKNFGCRPVLSESDLENAYRLVYREYLKKNYCAKNKHGLHYSIYSLLPESRTFLLEKNEVLAGTVSLIADSPCGLPLETIFPGEISSLRKPGRKIAEVGLLALDSDAFNKGSFSLTDFQKLTGSFRLFKIMFDYARTAGGVTDLVIGMHPKHKDLYRYLHFDTLGPVRSYPGAQGKPALLMHLDLAHAMQTASLKRGAGLYFLKDLMTAEELTRYMTWSKKLFHEYLAKEVIKKELILKNKAYLESLYPAPEPSPGKSALQKGEAA